MYCYSSYYRKTGLGFLLVISLLSAAACSIASEHSYSLSGRTRLVDIHSESNIEHEKQGRATSLRLRGEWHAKWQDWLNTELELDYVATAWKSEHNNGVNLTQKPLIPDVNGAEVNQSFLQFNLSNTTLFFGRRRIELDDQRFIGSNNFWQNDQTFDSVSASHSFWSASKLQYIYISNVNRILGNNTNLRLMPSQMGYQAGAQNTRPVALLGDHKHRTHLLHAKFREWDHQSLTGFYYHIDNRDERQTSNQTLGFRYELDQRFGALKSEVIASMATQKRKPLEEISSNQSDYQYYTLLEATLGYRSSQIGVRYEKLSADDNLAFITPLGALHDFHGWADKFNQSALGIIDRSVHTGFRKSPWRFDVRHHWFKTDEHTIDWGREWDLDITYKFNRDHKILMRLADFQSASQSRIAFPSERRIYLNYSFSFD